MVDMPDTSPLRTLLRSLPVLDGVIPDFDPESVPVSPATLFTTWLTTAIDAGVAEPHAMVVSTCDEHGVPDARVLILKDLDESGWWFATSAASAQGQQMASRPAAALTFYWPLIGRQVRIRGPVIRASAALSAADFLARGLGARAIALASTQSAPLSNTGERVAAVEQAQAQLVDKPDLVSPSWALYVVAADQVEFWQANKNRQHTRVRYYRTGDSWSHQLLWP